jgi:hypothetical protein
MWKGTIMQPTTSLYKALHIVHKQHMHIKVNKTHKHFYRIYMHRGLPCSKEKVRIHDAS